MKILKSILLGLSLLVVCGAAKASDVPLTEDYVINTYVDALTQGNLNGINNILAANAQFNVLQNKKVVTFSKQDMVDYLKSNKGVQQNCITATTLIENNADNAIVKVDMKYADHVQSNLVTMINTDNGWKISNVYSIFE
ncbi:MAG: putative lumazine-binding protein [Mucilaginibacter sp.]|nr:putative lumazine-binding protein [Mucilaginibacter sp.]